jgi:hypothetical protein
MVKKEETQTTETPDVVKTGDSGNNDDSTNQNDSKDNGGISLSEEQQKLMDNAIKERLAREREKLNKQKDIEIQKAKEEAEKMAKLSSEEREKELALQREKELEDKNKDLSRRENTLTAKEMFAEAKIPVELVELVVDVDPEKTQEKAQAFIDNFSKSVADGVASKLQGNIPKDVNANNKPKEKASLRSAL